MCKGVGGFLRLALSTSLHSSSLYRKGLSGRGEGILEACTLGFFACIKSMDQFFPGGVGGSGGMHSQLCFLPLVYTAMG